MPERYENAISWAPLDQVEDQALEQVKQLGSMPFIEGPVRVMPDVHWGMGAPIGTVFATKGNVIPAAVGVDIGCGMMATKTSLTRADLPTDLRRLRETIESLIPLGPGKQNNGLTSTAEQRIRQLEYEVETASPHVATTTIRMRLHNAGTDWRHQLGTLGGGNHFIEIVVDRDDHVWGFLHSGSRGIGARLASYYTKQARELCERWHVPLPNKDLAFLPREECANKEYIACLKWLQRYAELNREEMMDRVLQALNICVGEHEVIDEVRCHHNFAQWEHHYGRDLFVTRKGAIGAAEGQRGLIPGSMATGSFVVTGKGNRSSLHSAPHGAGRRMSRKKAYQTFTMEDFDRQMKGVEVRRDPDFIDELPGAYKDINDVIERCEDLVEVNNAFVQLVNVKGA